MAPVKGKPVYEPGKNVEGCGPSKRFTTNKFKIYSENEKASACGREAVGSNGSRKSIIMKKMTKDTKANSAEVPTGECKGGKLDTHVGRKALSDVSNVARTSLVKEVHAASKLSKKKNEVGTSTRDSWALSRRNSSASLSQSLVGKRTSSTSCGIDSSHASGQVRDNISARGTSSFQKPKAQVCKNVKDRCTTKSTTNQVVRRSFPVSRKASHGDKSNAKENAESTDANKRTYGFHVKTSIGGKVISRASDARSRLWKDRVSDGFLVMGSRGQSNVDACKRLRKLVKPISRSGLTTSKAGRPPNSRCISSLDKSQPAIPLKRDTEVTSCLPKSIESVVHHNVAEEELEIKGDNILNPKISDTSARRKADRRKSYTSMLISGSKLLEESAVKKQEKLSCIDDQANPLEVAEYVDEIYLYYWAMEAQSTSLTDYMRTQTEVTPQMRGVLINWLIEVHHKFDLMPETLYLTVALLDRYLSLVTIRKGQMQLVGLTALLLASKYEDFWHPRVKELVSISAESYTTEQMLEMEKDILRKLMFRFNLPTAYVFMLRFLKASQSNTKQFEHLAFYLIDLCLVEYEALSFKASMLCAAAIYLARCTLQITPGWTPLLVHHTHYQKSEIRDCAEMILRLQKAAKDGVLKVTYDKYRRAELGKVAAIKPLQCLPH